MIDEVDSLVGNEFEVEIDGQPVTGMFRIENFVTFALDETTGERTPAAHPTD